LGKLDRQNHKRGLKNNQKIITNMGKMGWDFRAPGRRKAEQKVLGAG